MENTVTISMERYEELIKKEVGFDYRKAELEESTYLSKEDRLLFGIPQPEQAEK